MIAKAILAVILAALPIAAQNSTSNGPASQPGTASTPATVTKMDPQKEADIRRLMQITGAGDLGMQAMRDSETSLRPLLEKSLPPGEYRARLIDLFFQKFQAEVSGDSLVNLVMPVYDRHFTDEELKGLIAFYETPLGKKAVVTLPQVIAEAGDLGRTWGSELGKKCMTEVLEEHPDLAEQLKAASK